MRIKLPQAIPKIYPKVRSPRTLFRPCIEREGLDAEIKDYLPITVEEEIVCYADKFHTKYPSFSNFESISRRLSKFDPDRMVRLDTFRRKYGLPELGELEEKNAEWSKRISTQINKLSD